MRSIVLSVLTITILITGISSMNQAFAQGVQTSGGVNVEGTWYVGENLEKGDYFEYILCELDMNDCAPFIMKIWIRGDRTHVTETLWDAAVVVEDGNKIIKGFIGLGKVAPDPIIQSDELFHYALAFKSSITWLSAFATGDASDRVHGPQPFTKPAWGKIGAIGGSQLIPRWAETIVVQGGVFDTVVVGWYSGNSNLIWVVDDFPFPVKAKTYAWVTTGIAPVMYEFELLKYEKNVTSDPFKDVIPTVDEKKLLGCPDRFIDYVSETKATSTFSMSVEIAYSPENPMTGCDLDLRLNFKNKYNIVQFVDQVHYDIWVVDDNGDKIRSYAEDIGRIDLFNGFGQAHLLLPVEEPPGLTHYVIFVKGSYPQYEDPDAELAGFIVLDIQVLENKNIEQPSNIIVDTPSEPKVPSWVKNNAGWWANGQIGDSDFVSGIQFLIKEGIIKIPSTAQGAGSGSDEIPEWIKNNAGWWANGQIGDSDFVSGIQFLIKEGIMRIS